jgi:hypothetical protein
MVKKNGEPSEEVAKWIVDATMRPFTILRAQSSQ